MELFTHGRPGFASWYIQESGIRKQFLLTVGCLIHVLPPLCKNLLPVQILHFYPSPQMVLECLAYQWCIEHQALCPLCRFRVVVGTNIQQLSRTRLIHHAALSHSEIMGIVSAATQQQTLCIERNDVLGHTCILPFPKVVCPTRIARPLSCKAPARISLALALPSLT